MSKFKTLVEKVLKEKGWSHDEEHDEWYTDGSDNTGEYDIEWTIDVPMNDELRKIMSDYYGEEDLKDWETGEWLPEYECDARVTYNIENDGDGEYVWVTDVNLLDDKETDITRFLSEDYIRNLSNEIEERGDIQLAYYDPYEEHRTY